MVESIWKPNRIFLARTQDFKKNSPQKIQENNKKNVKKKNTKDSVDRRNPKQPPNMCEAPANNVIFTKRSYM